MGTSEPQGSLDAGQSSGGTSAGPDVEPPILRVGCAMWAYRGWMGRYFPSDTPTGRELVPYSSWCTAVEGNTTFYGLPAPATVARWAEDAPPGFRFMFKVPELISHKRRLRNCGDELDEFIDRLEPLGDRATPLYLQLPASFGPGDLGALAQFLSVASATRRWAVEVRDPAFCGGGDEERRLNDLLAENRAERVIIDTRAVFAGPCETPEEREAFERKPRLTVRPVAIGQYPVVRFIGQTDPEANPAWWSKWVPKVAQWLEEGRSPTVFIHTPDNLVAPELARRFHREVAANVGPLAPLPEPLQPASQQSLL